MLFPRDGNVLRSTPSPTLTRATLPAGMRVDGPSTSRRTLDDAYESQRMIEALSNSVAELKVDRANFATLDHVSKGVSSLTRYMDEINKNVTQETTQRRLEMEQMSTKMNENMSAGVALLNQELKKFSEQLATIKMELGDVTYRMGEQERIGERNALQDADSRKLPVQWDYIESLSASQKSPAQALPKSTVGVEDLALKISELEHLIMQMPLRPEIDEDKANIVQLFAHTDLLKQRCDSFETEISAETRDLQDKLARQCESFETFKDIFAHRCHTFETETTAETAALCRSVTELKLADEGRRQLQAELATHCQHLEALKFKFTERCDTLQTEMHVETAALRDEGRRNLQEMFANQSETFGTFKEEVAAVMTRMAELQAKDEAHHELQEIQYQRLNARIDTVVVPSASGLEFNAGFMKQVDQSRQETEGMIFSIRNDIRKLQSEILARADDNGHCKLELDRLREQLQISLVDRIGDLTRIPRHDGEMKVSDHLDLLNARMEIAQNAIASLRTAQANIHEDLQGIRSVSQDKVLESRPDLGSAGELSESLQELSKELSILKNGVAVNSQKADLIDELQESHSSMRQEFLSIRSVCVDKMPLRIQELSNEVNLLKDGSSKKLALIAELQASHASACQEFQSIRSARLDKMPESLQELTKDVSLLKNGVAINSQKVDLIDELQASHQVRMRELSNEVSLLKNDVADSSKKLSLIDELQASHASTCQEFQSIRSARLDKMPERLQEFSKELSVLKNYVADSSRKLAYLDDISNDFRKQTSDAGQLSARLDTFGGEYQKSSEKISVLEEQIAVLHTHVWTLQETTQTKEASSIDFAALEGRLKVALEDASMQVSLGNGTSNERLEKALNDFQSEAGQTFQNIQNDVHDLRIGLQASVQDLRMGLQASADECKNCVQDLRLGLQTNADKCNELGACFINDLEGLEARILAVVRTEVGDLKSITKHEGVMSVTEHLDALNAKAEITQNAIFSLQAKQGEKSQDVLSSELVVTEERIQAAAMGAVETSIQRHVTALRSHLNMLQTKVDDFNKAFASLKEGTADANDQTNSKILKLSQEMMAQLGTLRQNMSDNARVLTTSQEHNLKNSKELRNDIALLRKGNAALSDQAESKISQASKDLLAQVYALKQAVEENAKNLTQTQEKTVKSCKELRRDITSLGEAHGASLKQTESKISQVSQDMVTQISALKESVGNAASSEQVDRKMSRVSQDMVAQINALREAVGSDNKFSQVSQDILAQINALRQAVGNAASFEQTDSKISQVSQDMLAQMNALRQAVGNAASSEQVDRKMSQVSQDMLAQINALRQDVLENAEKLTQTQENYLKGSMALSRRVDELIQISNQPLTPTKEGQMAGGQFAELSKRLDVLSLEYQRSHADIAALEETTEFVRSKMEGALGDFKNTDSMLRERIELVRDEMQSALENLQNDSHKIEESSNISSQTKLGNSVTTAAAGSGCCILPSESLIVRSDSAQLKKSSVSLPLPSMQIADKVKRSSVLVRDVQRPNNSPVPLPRSPRMHTPPPRSETVAYASELQLGADKGKTDASVFSWLF